MKSLKDRETITDRERGMREIRYVVWKISVIPTVKALSKGSNRFCRLHRKTRVRIMAACQSAPCLPNANIIPILLNLNNNKPPSILFTCVSNAPLHKFNEQTLLHPCGGSVAAMRRRTCKRPLESHVPGFVMISEI
jgi:hypothetical protein